ncbi:MAG: RNA methyltransferase [Bacteroidales bacterium]|nr:RNA methyltransferase [Bacteroidales bacterium]
MKQKKYRDLHCCFVAEGSKLVLELTGSHFPIRQIYASTEWLRDNPLAPEMPVEEVKPFEMERITTLSTPSPVLAVVEMPAENTKPACRKEDLTLMLDGIQDPGNLGTMIRIADWFGIQQLICSKGCVDLYNPKVVQATMGSITRVKVNHVELSGFLGSLEEDIPVYGMGLEGENIFTADTKPRGIIVIGSEAHGISEEILRYVTNRLSIPCYPANRGDHAESLNAAVATGIACAEFRRTRDEGRGTKDEGRRTREEGRRTRDEENEE